MIGYKYFLILLFCISNISYAEDVFSKVDGPVRYITYVSDISSKKNTANHEHFIYGNEVYFNEEKQIIKRVFSKELGNVRNQEITYKYDEKNLLVEEKYIINGKYSFKKLYEYQDQRIKTITKINSAGETVIVESYTYNKDYTTCEKVVYSHQKKKRLSKYVLSYDNRKRLIKKVTYSDREEIRSVTVYEYDNNDNLIKSSTKNKNDSISGKEYTYNQYNNITKITSKSDNIIKTVTLYKYVKIDEYNNWLKREKYTINNKIIDSESREIHYYK